MSSKIYIDHGRKKWWILLIVQITYLCFEHYTWTLGIAFGFDFIVNFLWSHILRRNAASIAIDLLIRALLVVAGSTLNAFFGYVFDLSFFQGMPALFFGITLFLYVWIVKLMAPPDADASDARDIHPVTPLKPPKMRPPVDVYATMLLNLDFVFWAALTIFSLMYMDVLMFAEPWTYGMYYAYSVSVFFLVLVATVKGMEWWSGLIFLIFWVAVLGVGYPLATYTFALQRKYPLSQYFS